jgi:hypothetical protein
MCQVRFFFGYIGDWGIRDWEFGIRKAIIDVWDVVKNNLPNNKIEQMMNFV